MKSLDKTILNRLEVCVQRTGGKAALAASTHISLPQLFRYIKGESTLPSDRLVAIAHAANVPPSWLLTGEGSADLPPIKAFVPDERGIVLDARTLAECLSLVDTLDKEYGFDMTPGFKSEFCVALYQALYIESKLYDRPMKFETSKALEVYAYLSSIQGEIARKMILSTINVMDGVSKGTFPEKEARTFSNYLITTVRHFYNHPTINQPYYDRIGYALEADTQEFIEEMLKDVKQSFMFNDTIRTLDLGCGNGRHLLYFSKFKEFKLTGTDNTELSKKVCLSHEASGKLPKGTFVEGDLSRLPFEDNSFDLVFSNASTFHLPYFPDSPHGLNTALAEIHRILKPKGYLYIHSRHGAGYEPFPFFQLHNEGTIRQTAHRFNLQVKWFKKLYLQDSVEYIPKTLFNDWFSALLRKP